MKKDVEQVHMIRMNTGEDILVRIIEATENMVKVHLPFRIVYYASKEKPGVLAITLVPWVYKTISNEQIFSLFKKDIIFISKTNLDVLQYYIMASEFFDSDDDESSVIPISSIGIEEQAKLYEDFAQNDDLDINDPIAKAMIDDFFRKTRKDDSDDD